MTVPRATLPTEAEWLLREGGRQRRLSSGGRIVIDDEHWRLMSDQFDVGAGVRVLLTSADVHQPVALTPHQSVPGIWVTANIAVKGKVNLATSDGREATIDGSRSVLFRPADRPPSYISAPGRALKLAGYMLRADRVASLFEGRVPGPILPLVKRRLDASIILSSPVSQRLKLLANSLFEPRLNGPLRAIFMEGVVLQLFALQAAGHDIRRRERVVALSPTERTAITTARDHLLSDMRNPPTLGELAAGAGMSVKTLNAGFHMLYAATVYETLRNHRLEHALLALKSENVPIKTIAFRVGYNHVTNFITAFTRRFGAPPRRFTHGSSQMVDDDVRRGDLPVAARGGAAA